MALQTKTFSYGSLTDKDVLNGYLLELTVTEQSTDTVENTSAVDFVLKLRSGSKNRFTLYGIGASVSLNGAVVGTRDRYEEDQVSLGYNSSVTLVKGSCTVAHDDDGTKTMAVAFSISMATGSYVPGPVSVTGKSMTLTAIPRASTVAASDANIGAVSTVVVGRKSTAYTHTVAVQFGSITGYLNADGELVDTAVKMTAATIPFTLPESFYAEIPNAASAKCTLTCVTWSGDNVIGEKTAAFTATASKDLCAPEVSISVSDVNESTLALTGDENTLVRFFSTARCFASATAKNAATIRSLTVEGQAVTGEYVDFPNTEQSAFTALCADSRGYTSQASASAALIPYIQLTCNASAKRLSPTGGDALLTVKGNYYNGSFGLEENALALSYRINGGEYLAAAPVITDNGYTAEICLEGLDYTQSHTIEVLASDCLQDVPREVTVLPGIPVFDWGQSDFAFHVPVTFDGDVRVGGGVYRDGRDACGDTGWLDLGLSANVSETANSGLGHYAGCAYRVVGGNHVYVAFNVTATCAGTAVQVNGAAIPAAYRPASVVYALVALGGSRVARILVGTSGYAYIEWVRNIADDTEPDTHTVTWIDGYLDYWI